MSLDPQLTDVAGDAELIGDFIVESREHLNTVELHLLTLDQEPANTESLHAIFRGFHTIKGLAGFLGLDAIQEVAHEVETVLDGARNGVFRITAEHIDVILASKDYVNRWLGELDQKLASGRAPVAPESAALLASIRSLASSEQETEDPVLPAGLSALSLCEILDSPPRPDGRGSSFDTEPRPSGRGTCREVFTQTPVVSEARSIKVDTQKLDALVDMIGEMVIAQSLVTHDPDLSLAGKPRLTRNLAQLARITADVQRTAMSMRMIPIRQSFQKMSRLVRDLSRKTGKQVEFEMSGEETALDCNIVEELADPLMHMVRNAIDHGIENPDERIRAGKDPTARLRLKACHQGGHIMIQVMDDGRGLDPRKILRKAIERGVVKEGVELSESEIFNLIFAPGFSTADQVTSISGRGVGMDVVKRHIQKLRGRIEIQSTLGKGAIFLLKLPLTLAIIDGLLVGVGGQTYVVPLFAVCEIFKPAEEMLSTVENRDEMVLVRGSLLPIVRLHQRFGVQPKSENLCDSLLVVTEAEDKRFCVVVDELIGKQEVVIKSLGGLLQQIPGVAGGTILGDGRVGLILDPEGLFRQAA